MTRISFEDWLNGDAVAVGRAIMGALPPEAQVARAMAVLDLCRARCRAIPEIQRVAAIGRDAAKWHEGHDAFDDVRTLTLKEERSPTDPMIECLLFVAEISAQIIYNASGEPAPFGDDSPWWLASNARDFASEIATPEFDRSLWHALCGQDLSRHGGGAG
jgi:hypothetical protein